MTLANFARLHDIDPQFDLPSPEKRKKQTTGHLQLLMLPDQMERSLAGIAAQARTALQEKGVNTLYAAFGYLEWYENENSEIPMFAPLLLHQIDIERKLVYSKYQYNIGSLGEETNVNASLSARLDKDFGLRLPSFEEDDTPEAYYSKLEKIIRGKNRWRVRRFAVVGHFAFARLVIYNDLDPKLWPGQVGIVGNPSILELFAGKDKGDGGFSAEEYEVDNPTVASKVPLLITDADASQFSAIVDVMDGKNSRSKRASRYRQIPNNHKYYRGRFGKGKKRFICCREGSGTKCCEGAAQYRRARRFLLRDSFDKGAQKGLARGPQNPA